MLTQERRNEIFRSVDQYIRGGGISPFIARANGELGKVAEIINIPVEELQEHLAALDRELPPVGDY